MAGSLYEKPGLMRHARFNVAQAFDEMVRSFSDRPAVVFDEAHAVTYRQLDHLSNQIAGFLVAKGIRKGDRIAISMEKSLSAYALIVAALKTGAIYVALDPRNPAARREAILDQCSPCLLFSDAATDGQRIPVVPCPGNWEAPAFCESFATTSPDSSRIAGSDAAYIMFTSGSTGTPKGAVISNDNLLHFLDWARTDTRLRRKTSIHTLIRFTSITPSLTFTRHFLRAVVSCHSMPPRYRIQPRWSAAFAL